ncbi:YbaB/EbfC family nucleoid-associated protein [Tichowtungia aerotolerans]|uniref:Nucleoid-associated protein GT409_12690 n=1 Tax=Tichowtungia aerotolerans TaxID=2697043 RepID=A0A6P1M8P8_9BACT|nr:YbaB/EbfC family nucleoid-associated protein [Tichowtungia aerotolerans]QHI70261.1 YbaB/EbfC family nucleoid-associated protein [Tichowtungia aerotolerans]
MDMMKMMKQAASMQKDMKKKQKQLAKQTVEFSSKNGAVTVKMSCDMKIQSVQIQPEIVNPAEIKQLEIAVVDAVKGAINQAQSEAAKEMKSLTAGLNLPF